MGNFLTKYRLAVNRERQLRKYEQEFVFHGCDESEDKELCKVKAAFGRLVWQTGLKQRDVTVRKDSFEPAGLVSRTYKLGGHIFQTQEIIDADLYEAYQKAMSED